MENQDQKIDFLKNRYVAILSGLDTATPGKWGKMNVRQMTEHMIDYVRIASGKTLMEIVTPADMLPKMQGFLASEKPFRENTPNSLMPEEPLPVKYATRQDALNELQAEIDHFFEVHGQDVSRVTPNPFFGNLVFSQQVQLLHKHAVHHLRQFGVEV